MAARLKRVKRIDEKKHDGTVDKEDKHRESCQDARGFNTPIRFYRSDDFHSLRLKKTTTALLNLSLHLLLSQSFHRPDHPPQTSLVFVSNSYLVFGIRCRLQQKSLRNIVYELIISCFCYISFCPDGSRRTAAPRSRLGHAHVAFQATKWTARLLPGHLRCLAADSDSGEISASPMNC